MKSRRAFCRVMAVLAVVLVCFGASPARAGQAKATLLSGILYKVHAGFLEMKSDEKTIAVVEVDAATIYWNGKTDKAASKKDLATGDELIIEVLEKDGATVARKVRFLHRAS